MRRAITLALVLAPAVATAQTAGQVTFSPDALLNASDCTETPDQTPLDLSWTVTLDSSLTESSIPSGAKFKVYTSTTEVSSPTATTRCDGVSGSNQVDAAIDTTSKSGSATFKPFLFIPDSMTTSCSDETQTDRSIFVCVQLLDSGDKAIGIALGTLTLSTEKPGTPSSVRVESGDGALNVYWKEPTTGHEVAEYEVVATSLVDGSVHTSPRLSAGTLTYRLDDLVNGDQYSVVVYAYTASGTKGDGSAPIADEGAIPRPVQDFFDYYHTMLGREQGGCGTGAGAFSLLGAAALLAARRRK